MTGSKYRFKSGAHGERRFNLVFMNGILNSFERRYNIVTCPLDGGNYDLQVKSVDNLDNISDGVSVSNVYVPEILKWPRELRIDQIVGNDVTLSWVAGGGVRQPTGYKVYGNGGGGSTRPVDRLLSLATVDANTFTATITVGDGDWLFVVEAYDDGGETVNNFVAIDLNGDYASIVIPQTNIVPEEPDDVSDSSAYLVRLRNCSVGKCAIRIVHRDDTLTSWFRVYHDSGTGTIDWNNYFRFQRSTDEQYTDCVTDQICFVDVDTVYKIGVRPETADGVVGTNTVAYSVTLDGKAPDNVENFNIGVK